MGNVAEDTLLHMGASNGCLALLKVSLEQGCNLDALDGQGLTPLELARECNKLEAAAFIESWICKTAIERAMGNLGLIRPKFECAVGAGVVS